VPDYTNIDRQPHKLYICCEHDHCKCIQPDQLTKMACHTFYLDHSHFKLSEIDGLCAFMCPRMLPDSGANLVYLIPYIQYLENKENEL